MTDQTPQHDGSPDPHDPSPVGDLPEEVTERLSTGGAVTPRPDTDGQQRALERDGALTPRPIPEARYSTPDLGSGQPEWVASPPPDPFRPLASALPPPPASSESRSESAPYGGFARP
ncbi:MAG TPA: hypothetical protein VIS06_07910, partial [Mycobacteriales bacterium]